MDKLTASLSRTKELSEAGLQFIKESAEANKILGEGYCILSLNNDSTKGKEMVNIGKSLLAMAKYRWQNKLYLYRSGIVTKEQ
jgi:hypothetical protein